MSNSGRTTLAVFIAIMLCVSAAVMWMMGPYLLSLGVGVLLALLVRPVFVRLQKSNLSKNSASLVATLGLVVLVVSPAMLCIALAIRQGIAFSRTLLAGDFFSFQAATEQLVAWAALTGTELTPDEVGTKISETLQYVVTFSSKLVLDFAANVPNFLLQVVLASITCFFYLTDGGNFRDWLNNKVPLDPEIRVRLVSSVKNTAIGTIWATLAAGFTQSLLMFVAYLSLGLSGAFLAGGLTFVMAWIPFLGSYPVWVVGAIILYSKASLAKAVIMGAIGLFTGVVDNFVRPMVLKGRSDMHPLISLVAIFGGISMFGILGVFVGPILVALLIALLQTWPAVAERFGLMVRQAALESTDD